MRSRTLPAALVHALILSGCQGCGPSAPAATKGSSAPALSSLSTSSAAPSGVVALSVPAELKASTTSLELSGIAWSAALQRYLLVSDDTAAEGGKKTKHAPVVLAMSAAGVLDASPLRIDGIDELNDPESISAGPDGTFFIATSHSVNKHGHLPASRRKLLHLALDTGSRPSLRILGQVDLTQARSASGQTLLETARLGADGALDIEAMFFREGSLYIGLKAPLAEDGSATILRMDGAVASLAAGTIAPGSVALWSRARLCRPHEGRDVCEGVADLAFLPDGSVLLVGNSPKGMPSDGGGSLWRMEGPDKPASFIRQFAGLKPEGLTLSPDGSSAVIVFDTDGQPPLWTQAPLGSLTRQVP
jgi:hypothetical protein